MSEKELPDPLSQNTTENPIQTSSEAIIQAQTNFTDRHNFTSIAITANYNTGQKMSSIPVRPNSSRSSFIADDSASEISDVDFQSSRGPESSNYSSRVSTANSDANNRRKSAGNVALQNNTRVGSGRGDRIQKPIPVKISHSNATPQNSYGQNNNKQRHGTQKHISSNNNSKTQSTSGRDQTRRQKNTSTSSTTSTNKIKSGPNNNLNTPSSAVKTPIISTIQPIHGGLNMANRSESELSELKCRLASTSQENKCLLNELEVFKLRFNQLAQENRYLKLHHDKAAMRDKFEDEVISNTLLKKIQELKKEKETLVHDYENEEEFLTNDLSRKLTQLRNEKKELERTLEMEQQKQVSKLLRRIERMEKEMADKQKNLETLKHEKVDLEQTLEKEQEALVNRLWKKMDKLEKEKQYLQNQLGQPISLPPSPIPDQYGRCIQNQAGMPPMGANNSSAFYPNNNSRNLSYTAGSDSDRSLTNYNLGAQTPNQKNVVSGSTPISCSNQLGTQNLSTASLGSSNSIHNPEHDPTEGMSANIRQLRGECELLKRQLTKNQLDYKMHYDKISMDEKYLRDENKKLQKKLKLEKERSDRLCRALSESESSLDSSWLEWDALSASGMEYLKDLRHPKPRTVSSPQTHLGGPSGSQTNVARNQNQHSGSNPPGSQNANNNNNNITAMRYEPKYNHDIMMNYQMQNSLGNYQSHNNNNTNNSSTYIPDHSRSVAEAFAPTSHFSSHHNNVHHGNPHHPYSNMSIGGNPGVYNHNMYNTMNNPSKLSAPNMNFQNASGSQQNLTPISTSGVAVSYSGTSNNPSLRGDRDHPRLHDVDCHSLVSESGSELEKIMASSGISENDMQHNFMPGASASNYMDPRMFHNRSANPGQQLNYKRDHSTHSHRSIPVSDISKDNISGKNIDVFDQTSQDDILTSSIKENLTLNKDLNSKKNSLGSIYKNCVNGAKSMFSNNNASGDHATLAHNSINIGKNTTKSLNVLDTSRHSSTSSPKIAVVLDNSNDNSMHSSKEIDSELDFNDNEADDENDVEETENQRTTPTN